MSTNPPLISFRNFVAKLEAFAAERNLVFWLSGIKSLDEAPKTIVIVVHYPRDDEYMYPTDYGIHQTRRETDEFLRATWSEYRGPDAAPVIMEFEDTHFAGGWAQEAYKVGQTTHHDLLWIADELERCAFQNDGFYWLMDTKSLRRRPANDQLWVIADFKNFEAAKQKAKELGLLADLPVRVSNHADITDEFRLVIKDNAYQLGRAEGMRRLRKEFPDLVPVLFGTECEDGWYEILRKFFETVSRALPSGARFRPRQIKEKMGTLRIYYDILYPLREFRQSQQDDSKEQAYERDIRFAYMLAEFRSGHTCEQCGKLGKLRKRGGWLFVACEEHATHDGVYGEPLPYDPIWSIGDNQYRYDAEKDEIVEYRELKGSEGDG